jgi:ubiquinone/menaquinone biosynthesis C-methylase UbiE
MAIDLSINRKSDAYLDFVVGLKMLSNRVLTGKVQATYNKNSKATFAPQEASPEIIAEVAGLVEDLPEHQATRLINRKAQEMMWDGIESAYKDRYPALLAELNRPEPAPIGTLTLNPALPMPHYYAPHEFHIQPGSYYGDDRSAIVYNMGQAVYGLRNSQKNKNMDALARACPPPPTQDPKQVRILVMGCGFGTPVWSFCDIYPEAAIHGIDLAAAQLKLAHKKAEMMGKKVHFSQQNAECTNFESGSFDIILTNIMFHELDKPAIRTVTAEALRLLKPDGHFVNSDVMPYRELSPFMQFVTDWQVEHNGEPYWRSTLLETALPKVFEEVGFKEVREFGLNSNPANPKLPWLTIGKK